VQVLLHALESYSECSDGCTCGDGWSHEFAIKALEYWNSPTTVAGEREAASPPTPDQFVDSNKVMGKDGKAPVPSGVEEVMKKLIQNMQDAIDGDWAFDVTISEWIRQAESILAAIRKHKEGR
jgi:hypothetical protein